MLISRSFSKIFRLYIYIYIASSPLSLSLRLSLSLQRERVLNWERDFHQFIISNRFVFSIICPRLLSFRVGDDTLLVLAGFEGRFTRAALRRKAETKNNPIPSYPEEEMLENRVIARLPRAMMAALSTAIGRWVITRSSSLPLHRAFKDTMSHR